MLELIFDLYAKFKASESHLHSMEVGDEFEIPQGFEWRLLHNLFHVSVHFKREK